ncbi:MAG: site-specific integrase, partial [Cyanobacteria bacterium J06639_1]
WIEKFEEDYFTRRSRTPKTETTWKKHYRAIFRRLPQERELTPQILLDAVTATKADTASRKQACIVTGALGKFAQIEFDPKPYRGSYSPKRAKPRDLPDDNTIAEWFYKIQNPSWRWVYGILACYGLRPHEVFHIDPDSLQEEPGILTLKDGKTGGRRIWPCYPEWWREFGLGTIQLPAVHGRANSELGERVTQYLRRNARLPFVPYALRHCWAIRTLEFGLDLSLASQQMGHSVQVHTDLYHHWISDRHHQRAFELLMSREDRPQPPAL